MGWGSGSKNRRPKRSNCLKIGVISSVFGSPWAGSEELWYQTSLNCLAKGHDVKASLFEINEACQQLDDFRRKGGQILFRKRFKNGRIHVLKHSYLSSFNSLFNWRPDVVILSLGSLTDLTLYPDLWRHLAANTKIRIILICLFNSDNAVYNASVRSCISFFCQRSEHLIFVSKHNYFLAERQLAMRFKNVSVFSSPMSFSYSCKRLEWPDDNTVLKMACVARLDVAAKGHDILLASLAEPDWKIRSWHLSIFGTGSDAEYIKKLVNLYELEAHVSFSGFVPDTREIWRSHHAIVMASRAEGLSLAVLEAMICGRVSIVSNVGGHGEIITDSYSGFLSEGPQPRYFSAALERAWKMRDQFQVIGLNASVAASEVFKEDPVEKLTAIIESRNDASKV
jgi:glycosyltransferase involved in cell wall biosynthesis